MASKLLMLSGRTSKIRNVAVTEPSQIGVGRICFRISINGIFDGLISLTQITEFSGTNGLCRGGYLWVLHICR